MTLTQYYVASTIDGFIADENDRLDWLLQFGFDAFRESYDGFLAEVGALVMGATTYEFILRQDPEHWDYADRPTWVLTHRDLSRIPGGNITFTSEADIADLHRKLVDGADGKNVWIVGGGNVAAQFANLGLIDELVVTIMPIVLGSGKPLLPIASIAGPLGLLRTSSFDNGALELAYRM
ncbi:dihydrofolate reductase family protein [Parafrigoribacterium mesophilum]|uniref:dihydrofolate reductase family protein n=1 Tax=Parafrigoribacterium mesophilum TaxID=433646 RepID=UPI0031FDA5F2